MKLSNKNFTILHGVGKKQVLTESDCFDNLANALSVYRKLDYSNITVFHPLEKDIRIDNQPSEHCGSQTGYMMFDCYGCWYEIKPDNGSENFWMIGDYPYQY
jgi:hypothetical protein